MYVLCQLKWNVAIMSLIPTGILREGLSSAVGFSDLPARSTKLGSKTLTSEIIFFLSILYFLTCLRFLEAFDMTAEMQFLPDLLQSGQRLTHVLDLENDWQSKVPLEFKITTLMSKSSTFLCRVGNNPYPKAGLCLLLYQDKRSWFCLHIVSSFALALTLPTLVPLAISFCSFCHPMHITLTSKWSSIFSQFVHSQKTYKVQPR